MLTNLGKKTKEKLPDCEHRKDALASGTLEPLSRYEIKWGRTPLASQPYLHCKDCDTTALNALPKKHAERVQGYHSIPEDVSICEACEESYDSELSDSDRVCESCDIVVAPCTSCNKLTDIGDLDDDVCESCLAKEIDTGQTPD